MCGPDCYESLEHSRYRWLVWIGILGVLVYVGLTVLSGCGPSAADCRAMCPSGVAHYQNGLMLAVECECRSSCLLP